jgi:drug/metabolite transporter (DMT)-like permease
MHSRSIHASLFTCCDIKRRRPVFAARSPRATRSEILPARAAAAIIYFNVFGSVLSFALYYFYYYVIRHMAASRVTFITLITPVLALFIGHLFNGEQISVRQWLGTILISLGQEVHEWRQRGLR